MRCSVNHPMSTASPAARKVVRKTRTEESASTYRPRSRARDGARGSLLDGLRGNEDGQMLVFPGVAGKQAAGQFWPGIGVLQPKPCTRKLERVRQGCIVFSYGVCFSNGFRHVSAKPICGFTRRPSLPLGGHSGANCTRS